MATNGNARRQGDARVKCTWSRLVSREIQNHRAERDVNIDILKLPRSMEADGTIKGQSLMPETLSIALKEWAAICLALIEGQQSLIVRKGGIAEASGDFQIEATRFLLYPTFVHQQEMGLCPDAKPLLDAAQKSQPRAGTVRLEAWAEVTGVYQVRDLVPARFCSHTYTNIRTTPSRSDFITARQV